jgi:ABC-type cobalamin/Fe3+-siderophores transport system ATPase subunit
MGVSQYVIRSVQGLIENLRLKRENNALALILKKNETDKFEKINDRSADLKTANTKQISFNLSGVEINISTAAGLSVIHAPNGSGKSTLLRSLCSLQENNSFVEQGKLEEARNLLLERGCYYLSSSAPCFEEFKGFLSQVLGPQKTSLNTHKTEKIYNEMSKRLPSPLIERWRVVLEKLNEKYPENDSAPLTLSAGEGNLLAWFRLWADFPKKIEFLFLDEAFSSLDSGTINLCRETLLALSSELRIVYVTHDRFEEWNRLPHWNRGYFLACSEDEASGFCLPFWLRSTLGHGVIDARGSIAKNALGLCRRVLKTLCEVDPNMEAAKNRNFTLYCEFPEYDVGETDSAALSLAITFQNLMRSLNFKPLISRTAGTAQIDLDGDFHGVIGSDAKRRASEKLGLRVLTQEDVASFQSLASL